MVSPRPSSFMTDVLDDTALSQTGPTLSKERVWAMLRVPAPSGVLACRQRRDDAGYVPVLWLVSRRIGGYRGCFPQTVRSRGGTYDGRDTRGGRQSACPVGGNYVPHKCR